MISDVLTKPFFEVANKDTVRKSIALKSDEIFESLMESDMLSPTIGVALTGIPPRDLDQQIRAEPLIPVMLGSSFEDCVQASRVIAVFSQSDKILEIVNGKDLRVLASFSGLPNVVDYSRRLVGRKIEMLPEVKDLKEPSLEKLQVVCLGILIGFLPPIITKRLAYTQPASDFPIPISIAEREADMRNFRDMALLSFSLLKAKS